jgi:hypothetical protein
MSNLKEISASDFLGNTNNKRNGGGTRSLILSYMRQNPDGVTTKMVADMADISDRRARAILNELCNRREIYYRRLSGAKTKIYYPNGRLIHKYLQETKDFGSQRFRISFHEGRREPRIQIQEREFTLLEGESVKGSIYIDLSNIDKFNDFIGEMLVKFYHFQEKEGGK